MRFSHVAVCAVIALTVAGCTGARMGGAPTAARPAAAPVIDMSNAVWLRTDGQSGRTNPALAAQFENDRSACTVSGGIQRACMTQRGYIAVPQDQAEATAARLRAANPALQQQSQTY